MLVVHGQEITKQLEEDFNGLKKQSLQVKKDGSYQKNKNMKESTMDGRKQGDDQSFILYHTGHSVIWHKTGMRCLRLTVQYKEKGHMWNTL